MIGKTISHYRILSKIGEGGMGVVYKAQDTRLKRTVALKFLPQHLLIDKEGKTRFLREAQAAAALNHPYICTIYESDEVKGKTFLSMEYIDGQTLEEKIKSGPLPLEEVLDVAIKMADGLGEAHEKGIIHRDIKSANIMLTKKGQVKIMDFGLAKLPGLTQLTLTATVMGTVSYMSPEQAQAEKVDQRSDIWSLGVILYQMISGQLPFQGNNAAAVLYSIVNKEPRPLRDLRPEVPPGLEKIVAKALKKNKEERYQRADEMINDLGSIQKMIKEAKVGKLKKRIGAGKRRFLFPPALILTAVIAAVIVILGTLLLLPKKGISFEDRDWVLIADFQNSTQNEIFSGAVEEALEKELSQSKYVNVVPPERKYDTLQLMKKELTVKVDEELAREIALRDEGIKAVIAGSIRQAGRTFSITVKVVNPQNGLTAASFTEIAQGMDDIFQAIHRLAVKVRKKLGESLAEIRLPEFQLKKDWYSRVTTSHLKALKFYRKAMAYANQFDWKNCLLFAKQAIDQDPSFAMAYILAAFMNGNLTSNAEARKYADRALQLMAGLTDREKYFIQGGHALIYKNYKKAIEQFSVLVDLYPDDYWGHINLFDVCLYSGSYQEAYKHLKEASRIRPKDPGAKGMLIFYELALNGDIEEARKYYEQIAQINPDFDYPFFQIFKFYEYWLNGDLDAAGKEAQAIINRTQGYSIWTDYGVKTALVNFESYSGKFKKALEDLKKIAEFYQEKKTPELEGDAYFQSALIWKQLGDEEKFKTQMQIIAKRFPGLLGDAASGWLAYYYAQKNSPREAKKILKRLKNSSLMDKEKKAFLLLIEGEFALQNKILEKAVARCKESAQLYPYIVHPPPQTFHPLLAQLALAEAYEESNRLDSAAETLQALIADKVRAFLPSFSLGPFIWIKAHYSLGRIYQKKGETGRAAVYYRKFLDLWKDADPGIAEVKDARKRLAGLKGQ